MKCQTGVLTVCGAAPAGEGLRRDGPAGEEPRRERQRVVTSTGNVVTCSACGTKNRVPAAAKGVPRCGKCRGALPWIVAADDATFRDVAMSSRLPVLVDLWAPWCGPCRIVSPELEKLAHRHAGRLKLVKVDVDQSPQTSSRFEARSIPTLLILQNGEVAARHVGAAPAEVLDQWLRGALEPIDR